MELLKAIGFFVLVALGIGAVVGVLALIATIGVVIGWLILAVVVVCFAALLLKDWISSAFD